MINLYSAVASIDSRLPKTLVDIAPAQLPIKPISSGAKPKATTGAVTAK